MKLTLCVTTNISSNIQPFYLYDIIMSVLISLLKYGHDISFIILQSSFAGPQPAPTVAAGARRRPSP